mmetsp:Transcript_10718/g.35508  ORF Transcript_10718/g.35508 Transcript_10718/m.35508 type:complete len:219 (+) Transcript_10718:1392-2048(+)
MLRGAGEPKFGRGLRCLPRHARRGLLRLSRKKGKAQVPRVSQRAPLGGRRRSPAATRQGPPRRAPGRLATGPLRRRGGRRRRRPRRPPWEKKKHRANRGARQTLRVSLGPRRLRPPRRRHLPRPPIPHRRGDPRPAGRPPRATHSRTRGPPPLSDHGYRLPWLAPRSPLAPSTNGRSRRTSDTTTQRRRRTTRGGGGLLRRFSCCCVKLQSSERARRV